eukprot:gene1729-2279_t
MTQRPSNCSTRRWTPTTVQIGETKNSLMSVMEDIRDVRKAIEIGGSQDYLEETPLQWCAYSVVKKTFRIENLKVELETFFKSVAFELQSWNGQLLNDIKTDYLEDVNKILLGKKNLHKTSTDCPGYVPTHNKAFSQALTGDAQVDAVNNRTKRKFEDRTGIRCGSHQQAVLLQTYTRDTGELMHDLSVPIMVNGRHWGGLRLGYKPEGQAGAR